MPRRRHTLRPFPEPPFPDPYDVAVGELRRTLELRGGPAWVASEALGSKASPEAFVVLSVAATDLDSQVRLEAIRALGRHTLGRQAAQIIIGALSDSSPAVVRTACVAVARLDLEQAHDRVARLLGDEHRLTRGDALRSLDMLWRETDFDLILRVHLGDPDVGVRRDAAFLLYSRVGPTSWRGLFDLWVKDPLARHRAWACELAVRYRSADVSRNIHPLLSDKDGHVRKAAARYFAAMGTSA